MSLLVGFCGGSILTIKPSGLLSGAKGYSWTVGVLELGLFTLKGSFKVLSVVELSSPAVLVLLLLPPKLCKSLVRTMVAVVAAFVGYRFLSCITLVLVGLCFESLVFESNSPGLIYERRKAGG